MKKLLFIAFYFPPRNNIACYRSGCFAKYLPDHGWLPTVLCQDWPSDRPDSDPDFVGDLPQSVQIHRIPPPPERGLYEKVLIRKVAPYVWPHRSPILWWRQARQQISSLLKTNCFDAVWATSDPLTPLTLGLEAAQAARIPWIADIRDCLNVQRFGSWYKRPFFRRQERRLCRMADRVVTVSEGLAAALRQFTSAPVTVIPNGFDASLLPAEPPEPSKIFTILYAGTLVPGRQDPRPVYRALDVCLSRGLIPSGKVELVFLGTRPETVNASLPDSLKHLPIRVLPRVRHREALVLQVQASVLLLFAHASEQGVMTGKIFDYLAAGRPILAVPDDQHTTAALLKSTGAGVALTEVEQIVRKLSEWYEQWKVNACFNLSGHKKEINRYSRWVQAGELAELLNQMLAAHLPNSR